ncbi:MAG: hypothetical protein KGY69_11840 [Bacteroidales bacterium]|nr:hypothetical protein [Bacteroidales bacterium]
MEYIFSFGKNWECTRWQLIQKINKLYPLIPIIIQASVITDDIAKMVRNSGADSYIAKPIHIYEMQKKVQTVLLANLDKLKRKHIKFLESILFGFGLSKLGLNSTTRTDKYSLKNTRNILKDYIYDRFTI